MVRSAWCSRSRTRTLCRRPGGLWSCWSSSVSLKFISRILKHIWINLNVFFTPLHVLLDDVNVLVPVRPRVFVVESQRVHHLVQDSTNVAHAVARVLGRYMVPNKLKIKNVKTFLYLFLPFLLLFPPPPMVRGRSFLLVLLLLLVWPLEWIVRRPQGEVLPSAAPTDVRPTPNYI